MSMMTRLTDAGMCHSEHATFHGKSREMFASVSPPTSTERLGKSVDRLLYFVGSTIRSAYL